MRQTIIYRNEGIDSKAKQYGDNDTMKVWDREREEKDIKVFKVVIK